VYLKPVFTSLFGDTKNSGLQPVETENALKQKAKP
jgi:hypothetical protein